MIPPDQEIYEVEKRIAERRHRVEAAARASARQAMRALTSPWALVGAVAIGFLVAGGVRRKHESGPALSRERGPETRFGGRRSACWPRLVAASRRAPALITG